MSYKLEYELISAGGDELESGKGLAVIEDESFSLDPESGALLAFSLRDINSLAAENYRINLEFGPGHKLHLTRLGYDHDSFLSALVSARNELILTDLLMHESLRKGGFKAEGLREEQSCSYRMADCELRLYETALVVLPRCGELTRLPYGEMVCLQEENYTLKVETEYDGVFTFSKMGTAFEPFARDLKAALSELSRMTQEILRDLAPEVDPLLIRQAANLMRDGRAASKLELQKAAPPLWDELVKNFDRAGIGEEFRYLESIARPDKISIGIKRGLLSDLEGQYFWFMVPVYALPGGGGNALIMEAASSDGSGRATYVFRLAGRKLYSSLKLPDGLDPHAERFAGTVNRCLQLINFRREPIYLSAVQLEQEKYSAYRHTINRIPALKILRDHFIGRVFHRSFEQWTTDLLDLLKFNTEVDDDILKWSKSGAGET